MKVFQHRKNTLLLFPFVLLVWLHQSSPCDGLKTPQVLAVAATLSTPQPTATKSEKENVDSQSPMDMEPWKRENMKKDPKFVITAWLLERFARVRKRDPPSVTKSKHIRLISITVSPYVEKVRWMLDLMETDPTSIVYYTEDCHPPGIAAYYTVKASNNQASQSPMIVL